MWERKTIFSVALFLMACANLDGAIAGDIKVRVLPIPHCRVYANIDDYTIGACPEENCTAMLNEYPDSRNSPDMIISRTADSLLIYLKENWFATKRVFFVYVLARVDLNLVIDAGREHLMSYNVPIESRVQNEVHTDGISNRLGPCPVLLFEITNLRINNGSHYGQKCDVNGTPCAFENSLCLNNKCGCSSKSVGNNKLCKLKVYEACSNSKECLINGSCVYGYCQCNINYKPNDDQGKCIKSYQGNPYFKQCYFNDGPCSSSAIVISSTLLMALQQCFVLLRQ